MLTCRNCGKELIAGVNWYNCSVKRREHLCKNCKQEYNSQHVNEANRRKYVREWTIKNKERVRESRKRRYLVNREKELENLRIYRNNHREEIRESMKKCYYKLRVEIIKYYSPELKCVKCGFGDIRALSIDVLEGGHRSKYSGDTSIFYRWLRRNGYPKGFQVLCMNCQFIKRQENHECCISKRIPKKV